jgi:hypothetical protein
LSILPLLLFGILLYGEKLSSLKELLLKIDFSSFAPVLKMLGIKQTAIDFLCSDSFEKVLSSQGDLKSLLPLLSTLFSKEKEQSSDENDLDTPSNADFISPIKKVAPTDIEETLSNYINS